MWLADGQGAAAARAVVALHSVEVIAELLDDAALLDGPLTAPMPAPVRPGVGVGWVDGPRGLLVHRYEADAAGTLVSATLLTPTAQNAAWLSEMLADALTAADTDRRDLALEDAIREADPCLPCSSSAVGAMGVRVDDQPAGGL
jgi:NAD-reducing hydrogenase large subunit